MFFDDVYPALAHPETGVWDLDACDGIWMLASIDSWEAKPTGQPVFLGRAQGNYIWSYDLRANTFAFQTIADAKAQLARADPQTSVPVFLLNLGEILRHEDAELEDVAPSPMSKAFFEYMKSPRSWIYRKAKK